MKTTMLADGRQNALVAPQTSFSALRSRAAKNADLYVLLIPGVLYVLIFRFAPLIGNVIAFKDLNLFAGNNIVDSIAKSEWVGFANFALAFGRQGFLQAFRNTLIISLMKIVILTPAPLILALMLNEVRTQAPRRLMQSVLVFPHFLSWVVVGSIFLQVLGSSGIVNQFLAILDIEPIIFFQSNVFFRWILVVSDGWKNAGYGTIIYFAAITAIDPQLYESAIIDGARRLQQIRYITIPGVASTFVLLLIISLGNLLKVGFEQVLVLYNPVVYDTGDVLQTFVYRIGIGRLDFSFGAAVGLFNSAVSFTLIVLANSASKRIGGKSIW